MPFHSIRTCLVFSLSALPIMAKWFPTSGPPNAGVPILYVQGGALYAGTESPVGLFKSTDSGNTWRAAGFKTSKLGVTDKSVEGMTSLGRYLFAGMSDSILRSEDGGETWRGVSPHMVEFLASGNGAVYGGNLGGLYRSLDSGATWDTAGPATGKYLECIAADGSTVYVGASDSGTIFKSSDRGGTWTRLAPAGKRAIYSLALAPGALFAGDEAGKVYLSRDGGVTWRASEIPGLASQFDSEVEALTVEGAAVFAATGSGLFGSSDTGKSWSLLSDRNLYDWDLRFNTVVRRGNWVYAGGKGGAIRVPTDGKGDAPVQINFGLGNAHITGLGVSGRRIFAGRSRKGVQSTAFGDYWVSIQSYGNLTPTAYLPLGRELLAASMGSSVGAGIRRYSIPASYNSWLPADTGLSETSVYALARMGNALFAASAKGVYRSDDSARHWKPAIPGLGAVPFRSLAVCASSLLAGSFDQGLFRSRDQGGSWQKTGEGVVKDPILALSGGGDAVLAAADSGRECMRSGDNGESWAKVQVGPPGTRVQALAFSGSVALAGTAQGVYRSLDSGRTWSDFSEGMFPLSFTDAQTDMSVTALAIGDTLVALGTARGTVWRRSPKELASASIVRGPSRRAKTRMPYFDPRLGRMAYPIPMGDSRGEGGVDAKGARVPVP